MMFTSRIVIVMALILPAMVGLAFSNRIVEKDTALDGTELVFAFMINRHGDRTPEQSQDFSNYGDVQTISALIQPWGFGQLTNNGIRTSYETGKFIRRRYKQLLPAKYNRSEVYIRSTDYTRAKMTVLTALAAVFPPTGETWSRNINWVPVPYTTVEPKNDYVLSFSSCPVYVKGFAEILQMSLNMTPHETSVIEEVSRIIDDKYLTFTPVRMFLVNDLYTSLIGLGYNFGKEVRALLPDIAAAAVKGYDALMADETMLKLQAGVLLNEFFTYAKEIIAGKSTPKVRIYSAHDINVYSMEAACQVQERQGVPKYGSLFALELRRILKTEQYVVVPVYLRDPHEGHEKYLPIQGCGVMCDLDDFYNITQKYLIDEADWRTTCGVTEDNVVTVS